MDDLKGLVELGRQVASEQDVALARHDLATGRHRLLLESGSDIRTNLGVRWRRTAFIVVGGIAAAAALVLLAVGINQKAEPDALQFRVGGQVVEQDALDNWWSAPSDEALPIEFSDGTTVALGPKSRARAFRISSPTCRYRAPNLPLPHRRTSRSPAAS